jgi:hypothetical protein
MRTLRRLPGVYLVISLVIAGIVALSAVSLVVADSPPTQEEIEFATTTTGLLQAELFAALLQEFAETTPENVDHGMLAISLIFADDNSAFRLVGEIDPLRENDVPQDNFEKDSLALALSGQDNETVEKVNGKYFVRRSIPLSNFDPSCVQCHVTFGSQNPDQFVGALMLKVPTDPDNLNKLGK